ncbi:hypothetical protein [Rhizobium ruizarguesonis]|uniref:hypothetical protein n=1 Tax=Rhizobium ruizarguesonis TaxID=2081791 RepID=UPI00048910E1|nr:hypothetical protein [Rhizobium ruizarguesonis]UFW98913.1 hypothetical protein RlegTA1_35925 [Rhizobium ruizarguesonis]WSH24614.1 hypothetical protein U8Q07_33735 [Rhizobium ruizarguesonis]WSH36314.1 hypothetical protein U8P70_26880 [Rhizobium ruizarguesonis]WSH60540.1 hypothetical protein U8P68_27495 [Rhizobium ruizarguesonis]
MFKGTIDRGHLECVAEPPMYPPPYPNISIKILDHPLLESFRWDTTDQIILICRERSAEANGQLVALRDWPIERAQDFCAFGQWPLDYQTISINRHSGTVTFSAGHGGVAPLYLKVSGERIDFSWSIADFYSDMTLADVDTDRTGLRLVGTLPYATTTMFRGVFMLTERASLCISRTGAVETKYPPPAPYFGSDSYLMISRSKLARLSERNQHHGEQVSSVVPDPGRIDC